MAVFLSKEELRPTFAAEDFFEWRDLFSNRKSGHMTEILRSFAASYPLKLINQIKFCKNFAERWNEMLIANHPATFPQHFLCKKLSIGMYLYNISQVRISLNLPKISFPPEKLELFEKKSYLQRVFSDRETIYLDPTPSECKDENSYIIYSICQQANPEMLYDFLAQVPNRDPIAVVGLFSNYLEKDIRMRLIRLATPMELTFALDIFSNDLSLRADIFRVRNAQLAPAWDQLRMGFFPAYNGNNYIQISDSPSASPDQGVFSDDEESSDEV